jgi:hypothetical protein
MIGTDELTGKPIYGACVDCFMALSNGISSVENAAERWEADFRREMGILDGRFFIMVDGGDLGFSMKPCDICRSKQGGSRHRVLIESPTEEEQ